MSVPSAAVKEQLHGLPAGYTQTDGVAERSRHRLLANGWHVGVARLMLYLIVMATQQTVSEAIPATPRTTTLQWVAQQLTGFPPVVGPGGWMSYPGSIPPSDDMWGHWNNSQLAIHPLQQHPRLPPGMRQTMTLQRRWLHDLDRIRKEIVDEITQLVEAAEEDTHSWWTGLAEHIRPVYYDREHDQVTQIPTFLYLLEITGYPDLQHLRDDLEHGFAVTGELHPGCGWSPRHDDKYSYPVDHATFMKLNRSYALEKLRRAHVDPHWKAMLDELIQERIKGRLSGPFRAPSWWPRSSLALDGIENLDLPTDEVAIAFCFSVTQSDKTRRCEDLRRSGHNATVMVRDTPHHDDLDVFIRVAHQYSLDGAETQSWSQDLAGAYRQFPVRNPNDCFVAINTPQGTFLFRHHAMAFGAVASVWGFNRCGDALSFLAQRVLFCLVGHYVDDFIGLEDSRSVESSFTSFTKMFATLGLRMKEAKASPPSPTQKLLGVILELHPVRARVCPRPARIEKLQQVIQTALNHDRLTTEEAHSLAGKLMFLTTTMFGNLGRAALVPIYSRAHGLQDIDGQECLNTGLRDGLTTLLSILSSLQPRVIPFTPGAPVTCIYTDAFFQLGDLKVKPSHCKLSRWYPSKAPLYINGWGLVLRINGEPFFSHGQVPPHVLRRYCSRKAYIYFLEIVTQVICLTFFRQQLPHLVVSFIDNQPGKHALTKGFGKDRAINRLLAMVWRLITHYQWHVSFEWVRSQCNIADGVSRHDLSEMDQIGATELTLCLKPFWRIICRVADDSAYAYGGALHDLLQLPLIALPEWSRRGQCGED